MHACFCRTCGIAHISILCLRPVKFAVTIPTTAEVRRQYHPDAGHQSFVGATANCSDTQERGPPSHKLIEVLHFTVSSACTRIYVPLVQLLLSLISFGTAVFIRETPSTVSLSGRKLWGEVAYPSPSHTPLVIYIYLFYVFGMPQALYMYVKNADTACSR